jgi:hypothetical protein
MSLPDFFFSNEAHRAKHAGNYHRIVTEYLKTIDGRTRLVDSCAKQIDAWLLEALSNGQGVSRHRSEITRLTYCLQFNLSHLTGEEAKVDHLRVASVFKHARQLYGDPLPPASWWWESDDRQERHMRPGDGFHYGLIKGEAIAPYEGGGPCWTVAFDDTPGLHIVAEHEVIPIPPRPIWWTKIGLLED